jgi:hypothetical protein
LTIYQLSFQVFWDSRSFIFLSLLLHSHSGLVFVYVGGLSFPTSKSVHFERENRTKHLTKHTCTPPSSLDYNKNFNWRKWKSWNLEGAKAFLKSHLHCLISPTMLGDVFTLVGQLQIWIPIQIAYSAQN